MKSTTVVTRSGHGAGREGECRDWAAGRVLKMEY